MEGATPPKGRGKWWTEGWTIYPSPVPHQRGKRGGRSLHQHPSRTARRCAGREGDTRGEASHRFFARDAGNPCYPASHAAFRESLEPQRRGASPSERKALWLIGKACHHLEWSLPPSVKGDTLYDGISLTPGSGNCRTILLRPRPPQRSTVSQSALEMAWRTSVDLSCGADLLVDCGSEQVILC